MKSILFILSVAVACGFIGLLIAPFFIPKGAGLAGVGTLLGYGIVGLLIGAVGAWFLKGRLSGSSLQNITYATAAFNLLMVIWMFWKSQTNKSAGSDIPPAPKREVTE